MSVMPISEAARADLYNGLSDLLGPERAETLMTHLPIYDPVEAATKSDVAGLRVDIKSDVGGLRADIGALESRLVSRLDRVETRLDGLGSRLDRLFLTLAAGFFVVVAAMAGVVFTTL